jgi:hypothetical protein
MDFSSFFFGVENQTMVTHSIFLGEVVQFFKNLQI